jgi:hypothetical protein
MAQQQSPWIEGSYGWNYGESGWNAGMDQNLLKFSFLFDGNVDSIVSSLPAVVNGQAHFLSTDNRFYFAANNIWYSSPCPKWFQFKIKSTGTTYQFNGTSAVLVDNVAEIDSRLDAVELTVSTLGSAAFQDASAFATPAQLDVVEANAANYTDDLRQDLANSTDPTKGAAQVGWRRSNPAGATSTVDKKLSSTRVDIWEFSDTVTSKPDTNDSETWDWTPAFVAAYAYLGSRGGILTMGAGGVFHASQIVMKRFVVIDGGNVASTELRQLPGSNVDFLISENFSSLTLTGLTAAVSNLVPSFFGLKDIRVNGTKSGNVAGRGVAWYGPAMIMSGVVLVYDCANEGIYTEYSNTSGSVGWQGQEEGQFGSVISRGNNNSGWIFRGPHNSRIESYLGGFNASNGGWGFKSESSAIDKYDGGLDWVGIMHTYANNPGDTGVSLNEIARVGSLITDGDNLEIGGSNVQIAMYRGYNIGGARAGLVITGNANTISSMNAVQWSSSVGRTAVTMSGARNRINSCDLSSNNPDNNGVVVGGNENYFSGRVNGFSAAGRTGFLYQATKTKLTHC